MQAAVKQFVSTVFPIRLATRVLSAEILRPNVRSVHLLQSNDSRCMSICDTFLKYPKYVDYIQTRGCVSSSTDAPVRFLKVQNLPLPSNSMDLKKIFPDVDFVEEPKMLDWGVSVLTVNEKDVQSCLQKNHSDFRGRSIVVKMIDENSSLSYSSKTNVLRVENFPYHWNRDQIKEFLFENSPKFRFLFLMPSVMGNKNNGCIYIMYYDVESKDNAKYILQGMKIIDDKTGVQRTLKTAGSSVPGMRNAQIQALRRRNKTQKNLGEIDV